MRAVIQSPNIWLPNTKTLTLEEKGRLLFKAIMGPDFMIPRFSPSEAGELFQFDGGHTPKSGSVYFRHPFAHNKYLLPSSFNISLARQKVFVFNQLAAFLGAKKIILRSGAVRSKKWNGKAKIPLSEAAAEVGLNAKFDSDSHELTQIYAEFDKPKKAPFVPEDLALWAKSDPLFESMVRSRIESRLRKQQVTLELKELSSFGGSVVGKYAGMGFDIGGNYSGLTHSVWFCDVEYWPNE